MISAQNILILMLKQHHNENLKKQTKKIPGNRNDTTEIEGFKGRQQRMDIYNTF